MFNAVTNDKISNVSYKNVFLKEEKQLSNAQFDTSLSLPFMGITSSKAQVVNTILNSSEQEKYTYLLNYLKDVPVSQNANGLKCAKQLELLLKNGKLLSRSTNDGTTTLDNLYDIATKRRAYELDSKNIISNVLNTLVDSRYVNQTFGDIPDVEKNQILQILPNDSNIKSSPNLMDVEASGTCAAASIEVNFANKYPAEFTRWVSKLSGEEKSVDINVKLTSLSPNLLEAVKILQIFQPKIKKFSWKEVVISVSTDPNAYIRAKIQDNYWDKGERSIVDVLIQSAIMQLGSQGTYDSLSDLRGGDNPQGLVEVEKTFVESVIKNTEEYVSKIHTVFALSCFDNLVKAGRVGKVAGILAARLGFWGVGIEQGGRIAFRAKIRGKKKAIAEMLTVMKENGFNGGDVVISHCHNEALALTMKEEIEKLDGCVSVTILPTRGLNSYYADNEGIIISY